MQTSILIVDDEPGIVKVLQEALRSEGYATLAAESGSKALQILRRHRVDLVLLDLRLGEGINGFQTMQKIREIDLRLPIIMITAYGNIETAVQAIKSGACDFVCKPFSVKELRDTVRTALDGCARNADGSERWLAEEADGISLHFGGLIGESAPMQDIYRLIERVAATDATVLIEGESGTGKELVARAIHSAGRRGRKPWVPLNCAAIPANLLESEMFGHLPGAFTGASFERRGLFLCAHEGTLLLDEIGVMDMGLQGKLLRALQEGKIRRIGEEKDIEVDVRVLAATNENLEEKVSSGQFREDLYYRVNVIPVRVPPLRRRGDDLLLLADAFRCQQSRALNRDIEFAPGLTEVLRQYPWPGNVRELQNAIACAAILAEGNVIEVGNLPPRIADLCLEQQLGGGVDESAAAGETTLRSFLKNKEQEYIETILRKTGGNRARAADMLGISRATFYRKYENIAQGQ